MKYWLCYIAVCLVHIGLATPALGERIELTTGEVLIAPVIDQDGRTLVLQHPVLGRISLPMSLVKAMLPEQPAVARNANIEAAPVAEAPAVAVPVGETPAAALPADEADVHEALAANRFWDNWDARLEMGVNGTQGNSDTSNFRLGFGATKETNRDRWDFAAVYNLAADGGKTNRHEGHTRVLKDWLMPGSAWFWFARGRAEFDEFQDWDYRVSGSGGPGYILVDEPKLRAVLRAGMGAQKEFGSTDNELVPEASFGGELVWEFAKGHKLTASST